MNELIEYEGKNTINTDVVKLTPAEQRLLEALLNPESSGKSVTEKCQMADISRETYYKTLKKVEFTNLLNKTAVDLVKENVVEIISAARKVAVNSGARGFQDRQMLLKMAGVLADKDSDNRIQIVNFMPERND